MRILSAAAIAAFTALSATGAVADDVLNFRTVYVNTSLQSVEVPDTEGHIFAQGRYAGAVLTGEGGREIGAAQFVFSADYVKGAGTYIAYAEANFADGSSIRYKATGTATPKGAQTRFEGPLTITGGKGRYEGATGTGSLTGGRLTSLKDGALTYFDISLAVKK